MQVEYIARISLASWRTAEQQGHGTIRNSVLGQVVIYTKYVFALIHKVFCHRYTGIRSQILQRSRISSGSRNDDSIIHSAVLFQSTNDASYVGSLLADSYINADHAEAFLVNDSIDSNGSFAGAAVTDDKFALAASDRNERIDTFDAGLQRSINGFTICDTMSSRFYRAFFSISDLAFAVDRSADSADNAAQQSFAYGNVHDVAGTANQIAFFNERFAAHQNDTNRVRVQVQNHAGNIVRQFNQFAGHSVFHTDNGSDAVTDLFNYTDLFQVNIHIVILQLFAESISHCFRFFQSIVMNVDTVHNNFHFLQFTKCGSIIYLVADLHDDTTENRRINIFIEENVAA